MVPALHSFETVATWRQAISTTIMESLAGSRGLPLIALPGGSTPQAFLPALVQALPSWRNITLTLTDDRQVPRCDPRSNAGMVGRLLVDRLDEAPAFLPPLTAAGDICLAARDLPSLRLDLIVLGLGEDGHIASLFPGSPALDDRSDTWVAVNDAPDGLARVSLPMACLTAAARMILIARGQTKRPLIDGAIAGTLPQELPLARMLAGRQPATAVYWCP